MLYTMRVLVFSQLLWLCFATSLSVADNHHVILFIFVSMRALLSSSPFVHCLSFSQCTPQSLSRPMMVSLSRWLDDIASVLVLVSDVASASASQFLPPSAPPPPRICAYQSINQPRKSGTLINVFFALSFISYFCRPRSHASNRIRAQRTLSHFLRDRCLGATVLCWGDPHAVLSTREPDLRLGPRHCRLGCLSP